MGGMPAAALTVLVQAKGIQKVTRDLRGVQSDLEGGAKRSSRFSAALSKGFAFVKRAAIPLGAAVGATGVKLIGLASDAEETASKFKTVFGREAPRATQQLDAFSKATGTSKFALREQAAGLQALIRPMGLSSKNAAEMSVGMTQLATDLSSFNNTSVEEAMTALQSGLVGEAEPMRKFGVQLSAARVETYAYAKGIAKQGSELTAAQKAQASYGIIMEDTKLAQGDAARTAGSFANQFKRLKSQVTDIATEIGIKLLPVATSLVGGITRLIAGFREGTGAGGVLRTALSTIAGVFTGIGGAIAGVIGWFREHDTVATALGVVLGTLATVWTTYKVAALAAAVATRTSAAAATQGTAVWIVKQAALIAVAAATRAYAAAQWLVNAAMRANPIMLVVTALTLIVGALVVAYKKSETFRRIVGAVFSWLKGAVGSVFGFVKRFIVGAWNTIKSVTSSVWNAIKSVLGGVWNGIKKVASTAWAGVKKVIIDPIRSAAGWVWDKIKWLGGALERGFKRIWDVAKNFASGLKDRIVGGFKTGINFIIDQLNRLIRAFNKLPGPNLGLIGALAQGGQVAKYAQGGITAGGVVRAPMLMMGEDAPRHPEWVIPTNPAYRARALGLLGAAARDIGVRGFAHGGRTASGGSVAHIDQSRDVHLHEHGDRHYHYEADEDRSTRRQLWQLRVAGLA